MKSVFRIFVVFLFGRIALSQECSNSNPCELKGGEPMPRCEEVVSKDGLLDIILNVEVATFKFEWLEVQRRSYNGTQCPPTWRVRPGDTVNVLLVNKLSDDNPKGEFNRLGKPNSTNLHTHGLHVSPREPQDNVFVEVGPGESYQYSYKLAQDHPTGTYFYHGHVHGSTSLQSHGGLAGMLIVEDNPEDPNLPEELKNISCPENCQHDISVVISPMMKMRSYTSVQISTMDNLRLNRTNITQGGNLEDWLTENVDYYTLNGKVLPTISIATRQLTRLRLLHVGHLSTLELSLVDNDERPAPCEIREIANDGIYFDQPRTPRLGQILLFPANRKDCLIKCNAAGQYKIVSRPKEIYKVAFSGFSRHAGTLATINVTNEQEAEELDFPTALPPRPDFVGDLRNVTPDRTIVIEAGGNATINRNTWRDPTDYRYKVEVDSVVEIQLISISPSFSHPIHFHTNHFQVIGYENFVGPVAYYQFMNPIMELRDQTGELCDYQYDGYKGIPLPFNFTDPLRYAGHKARLDKNGNDTLPYAQPGEWMDTIIALALSNVTLRMKMDKFTGPLLIHCHFPGDSDLGMLMVIEVVEKGEDVSGARVDSGGAFPGSCMRCDWNMFKNVPEDCHTTTEATTNSGNILFCRLIATTVLIALAGVVTAV